MKNRLLFTTLFLVLLTFLISCEKDDQINEEQQYNIPSQKVSYRMLTGKEARDKTKLLGSKMVGNFYLGTDLGKSGSNETINNGTVDYDNILEVIDTSGAANYTFKIINHPDDSDNIFHNLVISDDGTEQKVTLIKYEYENGASEMKNFEGKITARSLTPDEPCDETNIDGNLNTGTFGPGDGSGSNSGSTYPGGPGSGTTDPGDTGGTGDTGSGSGSSGFLTVSDQPATFHCNYCEYSASSWEEYSGHTDGLGNIYDFTIIFNLGRMADLNPDPNPCDAGGMIGVIEDEEDCPTLYSPEICECVANGSTVEECVFEDALYKMTVGMDKDCQALELFRSIFNVDSSFTNEMKNYFITENNNLNLQDVPPGTSEVAETGMPENVGARVLPQLINDDNFGDVIILEFNDTHLDTATTLGFVNTFYHELVHAYILSLYHSGELLNEYPEYTDLDTAITNYLGDTLNEGLLNIFDQEMHNVYIDFVNEIADSLVSYCEYKNINGVDLEYALNLVWGGLNGYEIFENSLTQTEQNEAQTLLAHENFNNTDNAKGTKDCE